MIAVIERTIFSPLVGGGDTDFQLHGPTDTVNNRYTSAIVREIRYDASRWNYGTLELWNVWQMFATAEDPDQNSATFRSSDYATGSQYLVTMNVVNDSLSSSGFAIEPSGLSDDFNVVMLKPGDSRTFSFPGDLGISLGPASSASDPVLGFLRYVYDPNGALEDEVRVRILLEI